VVFRLRRFSAWCSWLPVLCAACDPPANSAGPASGRASLPLAERAPAPVSASATSAAASVVASVAVSSAPLAVPSPKDLGPDAADGLRDAAGGGNAVTEPVPPGMKLVPAGSFQMGSDSDGQGDERPAHTVTLEAFWLDVTETTHAQYTECVKAGRCPAPDANTVSRFGGIFVAPNKPVTGISWDAAGEYCRFRGKRLPREAEFERAVRGDDGRRFPWGNERPTPERTVFHTNTTAEVGTHPLGRGPYGHDDLAGNVWEWMEDLYDPFAYTRPGANRGIPGTCEEILRAQNQLRSEGRQGYTGSNPIPNECERSIRGGAYNYDADGLRSTNRVHHPGKFRLLMTGVRCAKSVAAVTER
jgi:formylglycine-generating enzyme required for sulfatase activity